MNIGSTTTSSSTTRTRNEAATTAATATTPRTKAATRIIKYSLNKLTIQRRRKQPTHAQNKTITRRRRRRRRRRTTTTTNLLGIKYCHPSYILLNTFIAQALEHCQGLDDWLLLVGAIIPNSYCE